jgi:hypothetical protein
MTYFPQLSTGALVQYPLRKWRISRAVVNSMHDGSDRKLLDPVAAAVSWRLSFTGLTSEERIKLEQFFEFVEGRLGTFTFLDPTDNLLLWSEQLTSPAWITGPLLALDEGFADPLGTNRATRITNGGATVQAVEQTIPGPGWYRYCFSLWGRSAAASSVTLFRSTASTTESSKHAVGTSWRRLVLSGSFENTDEGVKFGLQFEPGAGAEVFGMQVECQPAASDYKRTTSRAGVYEMARLDDDSLDIVTEDLDAHSCMVRITAMAAG